MASGGDGAGPGKLHKGPASAPLKAVPGYKPVSSIPAKFETLLFTGPREKKGFLSEGKRFTEAEHDLPGPGAYSAQPKPLDAYRAESVGKKGYGAMVSKSRRFNDRVYYTGPAATDYRQAGGLLEDKKAFSRAPVSAAFQDKSTASRLPKDDDAVPGPGSYGVAGVTRTGAKMDYLSRTGASSAFKSSGGHELILLGNIEAPPPTTYDLGDLWDKSRSLSGRGGRGGTSSFGAGTRGGSVGSMASNLDTLLFGAAGSGKGAKAEASPGPGAYDLQDFASIRSKVAKQQGRPSPQFQQPEVTARSHNRHVLVSTSDRVAHDYLAPSHPPLRSQSPGKGVGAPFRSQSAGHQEYVEQRSYKTSANAPGPAYYQPETTLRKSFHRNAKQQYMTVAS